MNKEQKKPQEKCLCECHIYLFRDPLKEFAHCINCQKPQEDIFDELQKRFLRKNYNNRIPDQFIVVPFPMLKDWICANFIARRDLRKLLEEKKRVMAHIVGAKRVETPYVVIDDILAELKI